jgi:hypothetical protein
VNEITAAAAARPPTYVYIYGHIYTVYIYTVCVATGPDAIFPAKQQTVASLLLLLLLLLDCRFQQLLPHPQLVSAQLSLMPRSLQKISTPTRHPY